MFSVEIKLNSQLIGHIYGRRTTVLQDHAEDVYLYDYRYYYPENGKVIKGTVDHIYSEGVNKLVMKIMNEVMKDE